MRCKDDEITKFNVTVQIGITKMAVCQCLDPMNPVGARYLTVSIDVEQRIIGLRQYCR